MATAQKELHNQATNLANQTKEMAGEAAEKARDFGSTVAQKAGEAGSFVARKADDATSAVGAGMKSVAHSIRDKVPEKGVVGAAGSAVAETLEQSGQYLQDQGLTGIASDMTNVIRRSPIPSVLVSIAIGFLVARALTPRA